MTGPQARPSGLTRPGAVFAVLAAPPLLLLAITVGLAVWFASHGAPPGEVALRTQDAAPWILLCLQLVLLVLVGLLSRWPGGLGWRLPSGRRARTELLVGGVCGIALGLAYVLALSPLLTWAQRTVGDYVPAGSVLPTVGRSLWPFFVADVLLAPFVEESLYRGWATSRLLLRLAPLPTALIVCAAFGLLHWAGGVWYILLVGFVAGGLFIALRIMRQNLVAPFAAHFGLNAVEYLFVLLSH